MLDKRFLITDQPSIIIYFLTSKLARRSKLFKKNKTDTQEERKRTRLVSSQRTCSSSHIDMLKSLLVFPKSRILNKQNGTFELNKSKHKVNENLNFHSVRKGNFSNKIKLIIFKSQTFFSQTLKQGSIRPSLKFIGNLKQMNK